VNTVIHSGLANLGYSSHASGLFHKTMASSKGQVTSAYIESPIKNIRITIPSIKDL
jgi:hypothetical protein